MCIVGILIPHFSMFMQKIKHKLLMYLKIMSSMAYFPRFVTHCDTAYSVEPQSYFTSLIYSRTSAKLLLFAAKMLLFALIPVRQSTGPSQAKTS